jgi:hypothetical protein
MESAGQRLMIMAAVSIWSEQLAQHAMPTVMHWSVVHRFIICCVVP